jgi:uncharacterized protein YjbK
MVKNIEIENKFLVSKASFYKLLKHFGKNSSNLVKQTNYYLDTAKMELFKKHNGALRIRRRGDKFEMTIKQKSGNKSLETTIKVTGDDLKRLSKGSSKIKGIYQLLANYEIDATKLKLVAKLITYRLKLKYMGGEIFFDKNVYNVTTDYEIEYESSNYRSGNSKLLKLFKQLTIDDYVGSRPKVRRALNI